MSPVETVGGVLVGIIALLGIAAAGGALFVRWRSSGEDERFKRFKDAIEALEAEVAVRRMTGERQETKLTAQDKVIDQQQNQIDMLKTMVQGIDTLATMRTDIGERFDRVDRGIRDIKGMRGGTRSGEIGEP